MLLLSANLLFSHHPLSSKKDLEWYFTEGVNEAYKNIQTIYHSLGKWKLPTEAYSETSSIKN